MSSNQNQIANGKELWNKYREMIMYLIFGGLTFVVSMVSYILFLHLVKEALIANIFSWVVAVIFAYVTNRIWVFRSDVRGFSDILKEMSKFFAGRVFTLLLEEVILLVGISVLGIDEIVVKLIGQIVVIIGNYVVSKLFCFKNE